MTTGSILNGKYLRPLQHPKYHTFWKTQNAEHWDRNKYSLTSDLTDWKFKLNDSDRHLLGGILKSFATVEVSVGNYWRNVARIFTTPEIAGMADCFSAFEQIHIDNYVHLNEKLDLLNFEEFSKEDSIKEKLEFLIGKIENINFNQSERYIIENHKSSVKDIPELKNKIKDLAISLAIFSAFAEGVMIFSNFAVLYSYSRSPHNCMKGTATIVEWSIRDENYHSIAGMTLFNDLCDEFDWLRKECMSDVLEAAKRVVEIETNCINSLFENGMKTIQADDLINFVKVRINSQLNFIQYPSVFNEKLNENIKWFYDLSAKFHSDFFAGESNNYSTNELSSDDLF